MVINFLKFSQGYGYFTGYTYLIVQSTCLCNSLVKSPFQSNFCPNLGNILALFTFLFSFPQNSCFLPNIWTKKALNIFYLAFTISKPITGILIFILISQMVINVSQHQMSKLTPKTVLVFWQQSKTILSLMNQSTSQFVMNVRQRCSFQSYLQVS